jgi:hypothetical protein
MAKLKRIKSKGAQYRGAGVGNVSGSSGKGKTFGYDSMKKSKKAEPAKGKPSKTKPVPAKGGKAKGGK